VCTKPDGHQPVEHADAFGNTWPARENELRLSTPTDEIA
jgi:hypothetical protein